MTGSAVATQEKGTVPDLRRGTASSFGTEDLAFPRLYLAQSITKAVEEERGPKPGDFFYANDQDDPDPIIISKKGDKEGVLFHVVYMIKGKSRSIDGVLETWRYDDEDVPADAWTTYTYFLALPEVDPDIAFRWLLTKSGKPSAQKINTTIWRAQQNGTEPYVQAFRVTSGDKTNKKGQKYKVPLVRPVEATDSGLAVAKSLYSLVEANAERAQAASGEQPSI